MGYVAAFKWKRDRHYRDAGEHLGEHDQVLRSSSYLRLKQHGFISAEDVLHSLKDEIDHHENMTSNIYASVTG